MVGEIYQQATHFKAPRDKHSRCRRRRRPSSKTTQLTGPLFLENVKADVAVDVDVGVEAGGVKLDHGRLEGVLVGE